MKLEKYFPHDFGTVYLIKEIEAYLNLENKEVDEMNYTELIEYIDELALMLFKQ